MPDEEASGSQEQSYSILDLGLLLKVSFEEKVTDSTLPAVPAPASVVPWSKQRDQ